MILFCTLDNTLWLFILISILIIYIIFVFTSATVDEYVASGITALSEAMGLSDAMAAVTLIALANGAGDVITALVASGSDGGVSYNIGSLYGSGFFVCAFVIAATVLIFV